MPTVPIYLPSWHHSFNKVILLVILLNWRTVACSEEAKTSHQDSTGEFDDIVRLGNDVPGDIKEQKLTFHEIYSSDQANGLEASDFYADILETVEEHALYSKCHNTEDLGTMSSMSSGFSSGQQVSTSLPVKGSIHFVPLDTEKRWIKSNGLCTPDNRSIVITSEMTTECISSFNDFYTQEAFGLTWLETLSLFHDEQFDYEWLTICDKQDHCSPVLPQLPPNPYHPPQTQDALKGILIQVFGYAQRYIAALDSLLLDQSLGENKFISEMLETKRNMAGVVSVLMTSVSDCHLQIQEQLVHDLISKLYTNDDV
ncbi:hypothetical protein SK128_003870 [Halocaridina rubra]|uniref:Uncharacterized protein n=1 Tax=Halocaridina rubra TaxID=373956 RepID=A0AAN8WSR1_HALRR